MPMCLRSRACRIYGPKPTDTTTLVVCVHGINMGHWTWGRLAGELVAKGHTVLAYDTWGRGNSTVPKADQTSDLFVTQLSELLFHLGTLAGHP
jgi:pimeloyl-ACP methyl ester carboxylesterase